MGLGWFDAAEAKKFGAEMADLFVERLVPGEALAPRNKLLKQRAQALNHKITKQVEDFKGNNKLNVYKTAQIGLAFKEALIAAGYEESYVSELTHWLMYKIKGRS